MLPNRLNNIFETHGFFVKLPVKASLGTSATNILRGSIPKTALLIVVSIVPELILNALT